MLCISSVASSFAVAVSSMTDVEHVEYLSSYMSNYLTICSVLDTSYPCSRHPDDSFL